MMNVELASNSNNNNSLACLFILFYPLWQNYSGLLLTIQCSKCTYYFTCLLSSKPSSPIIEMFNTAMWMILVVVFTITVIGLRVSPVFKTNSFQPIN